MIYLVTITLYELSVTNYFVLTHLVANSSLTPILFLNAIVIEIPLMAVHFSYLFTLCLRKSLGAIPVSPKIK